MFFSDKSKTYYSFAKPLEHIVDAFAELQEWALKDQSSNVWMDDAYTAERRWLIRKVGHYSGAIEAIFICVAVPLAYGNLSHIFMPFATASVSIPLKRIMSLMILFMIPIAHWIYTIRFTRMLSGNFSYIIANNFIITRCISMVCVGFIVVLVYGWGIPSIEFDFLYTYEKTAYYAQYIISMLNVLSHIFQYSSSWIVAIIVFSAVTPIGILQVQRLKYIATSETKKDFEV